jgi:hypothetical protein
LDFSVSVPSVSEHIELFHRPVDRQAVAFATVPVVSTFLIHNLDLSTVGELQTSVTPVGSVIETMLARHDSVEFAHLSVGCFRMDSVNSNHLGALRIAGSSENTVSSARVRVGIASVSVLFGSADTCSRLGVCPSVNVSIPAREVTGLGGHCSRS